MLSRDRMSRYLVFGALITSTTALVAIGNIRTVHGGEAGTKTNEIATTLGEQSIPNYGSMIIWRYEGRRGFEPIFKEDFIDGGHEVVAGDLDHDGKDEFLACSRRGGVYIVDQGKTGDYSAKKLIDFEGRAEGVAIGDVLNDGRNSIVALQCSRQPNEKPIDPAKVHVFGEKRVTWPLYSVGRLYNGIVGDIDGDGQNELVTTDGQFTIAVSRWDGEKFEISKILGKNYLARGRKEWLRKRYENVAGNEGADFLPVLDGNVQEIAFGDLTGGGLPSLVVSSYSGKFHVFQTRAGKFGTMYESDDVCGHEENRYRYGRSCTIGDVNNDGRNEVVIGAVYPMVFGYENGKFKKLWEGDKEPISPPDPRAERKLVVNVSGVRIGDVDGDGRNELVFCEHVGYTDKLMMRTGHARLSRLVVLKDGGKENLDMQRVWESEPYPGHIRIAIGNFDGK